MTKSNPDAAPPQSQDTATQARSGAPHGDAEQPKAKENVPFAEREVPPLPRKRFLAIPILILFALLAFGAFEHFTTYQRATDTQQEALDFTPEVTTITAKAETGPIKLTLPGQTEAFFQSTVFPRATGYVAERHVDIGSHVKKGDLLIRISAPDLDQQLAQAKGQLAQSVAAQAQAQANVDQAKANLALANVTYARTNAMAERGYETVQNNDNRRTAVEAQRASVETAEAGIKVANANTQAAQATVNRLQSLVDFERVDAPYDGVITTRNVEVGDLVQADTKTGNPLFTIAYDKVLRVTVHVPQTNAFSIKDGLFATAYLPQKPQQTFSGKIARSSVALLNSARTLDTQVDVQNPSGTLKPGAFVNVSFDVPRLHPNIILPAEAMIFNQRGLQVAVVQDNEVHLQPIAIEHDLGDTLELREGLNGGEQVIINPPVDLIDRQKVKLKPKPPSEQAKT